MNYVQADKGNPEEVVDAFADAPTASYEEIPNDVEEKAEEVFA